MTPSPVTSPATSGIVSDAQKLRLEIQPGQGGDGEAFRAALDQHLQAGAMGKQSGHGNKVSLSDKMIERAGNLATEVKNDQQYVSRMLEQASRTGDSMQLMKAMMALNDYQLRVQFVSKTVSKATSSLDQLTKLQ